MSGALIAAIAALVGSGVFLITSRSLSRIVLGFALLGHAAVLSLLAAGGRSGAPPLADGTAVDISDPLPQAFSLTAIVISFGLTLFVLALARRQQVLTGDDLVEDDIEDRRIAAIAQARAERDEDDVVPDDIALDDMVPGTTSSASGDPHDGVAPDANGSEVES